MSPVPVTMLLLCGTPADIMDAPLLAGGHVTHAALDVDKEVVYVVQHADRRYQIVWIRNTRTACILSGGPVWVEIARPPHETLTTGLDLF